MGGDSRHSHGRSEALTRPTVLRALARERTRLGKRLRYLRKNRALTLEEASELGGLHPNHLQRIEVGNANVTLALLVALSQAYGVSLTNLFEDRVKAVDPATWRSRAKRRTKPS